MLSVLVPSFNSGAFIARAVESALAIRSFELEVIVQDGGSTDTTLVQLAQFDDRRVSVEVASDRGQADALNRALSRAQGDWVLWLNADDLVLAEALDAVGPMLDDASIDVITGDFRMIDVDGQVLKRYRSPGLDIQRLLRHGTYLFSGACLVRRHVLDELEGFDASLDYCMDFDLFLRMAGRVRSVHVSDELAAYREQPASKTSTAGWSMYAQHWNVLRPALARHPRAIPASLWYQALTAAYLLTRPLWRSRVWRRLRPAKTRGSWSGQSS